MRPGTLPPRGDVDPQRLAIRGGSAGGMTALNALAAGEGFAACVSWYGVTDLMGLVATTHDFEAHYTDRLIGPLPGSERPLRGALAPQPGRGHAGLGPLVAGHRGRGCPTGAGREHARRRWTRRGPGATCASSRGRATGSAGRTP